MINRQFTVVVYKADNTFYPGGVALAINCANAVMVDAFVMNTVGQIVPIPTKRNYYIPESDTPSSPPSDPVVDGADTVMVQRGTQSVAFNISNISAGTSVLPELERGFVYVIQIKDVVELVTYYVDMDDYINNGAAQCNPTS